MDGAKWNLQGITEQLRHQGSLKFSLDDLEDVLNSLASQGKIVRTEPKYAPGESQLYIRDVYYQKNPDYVEPLDGGLGRTFV